MLIVIYTHLATKRSLPIGGIMKKTAAGFALAAVLGFSVVSAAPAMALTPTGAYENCDEAAANGASHIPASDPRYGTHLDRDGDGVGCDAGAAPVAANPVAPVAPGVVDTTAPVEGAVPAPQIVQVPVGAPATGISQESNTDSLGSLLAAGGVLVAVAGASVAARRKSANA